MNIMETQQALARVLGIDFKRRRVVGFDVKCRVGEVIEVTVHEVLLRSTEIENLASQHFTLSLAKFDLNAMCDMAMSRVNAFIDQRAAEIQRSLRVYQ